MHRLGVMEIQSLKIRMARDLTLRYNKSNERLACTKAVAGVEPISATTLEKVKAGLTRRDQKPPVEAGDATLLA